MGNLEILALGEALIEFLCVQEDEPRPLYKQGFGGDTSNAIIAAARQGARTGYISAVGGDQFGKELFKLWQEEGVATETTNIYPADPTGVYFVHPHASGRCFSYARRGSAASLYRPDCLPEQQIRNAKVLHTSAISQSISPNMCAAVQRAAEITRDCETLFSFDTNLRLNLWHLNEAKAAIKCVLPIADIIFPSDDEAEQLTGLSDPDAIIDHFLHYGAQIVVLKRGAKGVVVATPTDRFTVAPAPSNPVDSTGAGDSFAGAFLAYYLETSDIHIAANYAVKVAAGTVSGFGAIDPIPYRRQVII